MFTCIYSLTEQQSSSGEHILQNFLGARRVSHEIVSDALQKAFGDGIDLDLSRTLKVLHNLMGTRGGRKGEAPTIKGMSTVEGQAVNFLPGGRVQMAAPILKEVELPEGTKQVQVTAANAQHLAWALSQIKQKYPNTEIDQEAILASAKWTEGYIEAPVVHELRLGGPELFRGLLKACFNLLGATHPNKALMPCFNGVRNYVRDGTGDAADYARWFGSTELPNLPQLGPADQHIFIVTRGSSVEGVARLFGSFNYPFQLTDSYSGPPLSCSYVVDPFREANPAELWQPAFDVEAVPRFLEQEDAWSPAVTKATEAAVARLMDLHFEIRRDEMLERSIQEVIRESAAEEFTEEAANKLADLLTKRLLRIPRELGPYGSDR